MKQKHFQDKKITRTRFLSLPEIVRNEEVGEENYLTLKGVTTNREIASCCGRT